MKPRPRPGLLCAAKARSSPGRGDRWCILCTTSRHCKPNLVVELESTPLSLSSSLPLCLAVLPSACSSTCTVRCLGKVLPSTEVGDRCGEATVARARKHLGRKRAHAEGRNFRRSNARFIYSEYKWYNWELQGKAEQGLLVAPVLL
jgi:hypothetical protein